MSRKTAIVLWWLLVFGILLVAVSSHAAPAPPKYDGQWVVTTTNTCNKPTSDLVIIVKGGKLATQNLLDITGKVSDNGQLDVVVSYNSKALYVTGHLSGNQGSGEWHTEGCVGKWKAERNGK